jgi:hypothetical protein
MNQLITSRTRREDFGSERNQSFKGDHGNAQFSLCCTSTAMPDDDSQDRHPAFFYSHVAAQPFSAVVRLILHPSPCGFSVCTFRFVSKNFNAAFPMFSCSLARSTPGASIQASGNCLVQPNRSHCRRSGGQPDRAARRVGHAGYISRQTRRLPKPLQA